MACRQIGWTEQQWGGITMKRSEYLLVYFFHYQCCVQVDKHESQAKQADYKAGFAGHGDREDVVGPVGTNYVKTKPDSKLLSLPGDWFISIF